jgi:hypothetical protein
MNERENILARFSDAYLLSMIEGRDGAVVANGYRREYPELESNFRESVSNLEMLYGYLRSADMPSQEEISGAYERLSAKLPERSPALSPVEKKSFPTLIIEQISGIFSRRPLLGGLSVGLTLAVVIGLVWQPWQINEQNGSIASKNEMVVTKGLPGGSVDLAAKDNPASSPNDPTAAQDPLYRGSSPAANPAEEKHLDAQDAKRLQSLVSDHTIFAPKDITTEVTSDGNILIRWSPSPNALAYLIEILHENGKAFEAVRQTSQPHTLLQGLASGEKVQIRIVPLAGDRRGPASAAKSVIVP